jgi:hypothetical protein
MEDKEIIEAQAQEETKSPFTTGKVKSEKSSPKGIRRFLQVFDVVGGNNMKSILLSLPFILFLVVLGFIHIANNHLAESYGRRISTTEKNVRDLRWQYMETTNKLMKKSRLSEVSKLVEEQGLKELRQPPYIIEVKKDKK